MYFPFQSVCPFNSLLKGNVLHLLNGIYHIKTTEWAASEATKIDTETISLVVIGFDPFAKLLCVFVEIETGGGGNLVKVTRQRPMHGWRVYDENHYFTGFIWPFMNSHVHPLCTFPLCFYSLCSFLAFFRSTFYCLYISWWEQPVVFVLRLAGVPSLRHVIFDHFPRGSLKLCVCLVFLLIIAV